VTREAEFVRPESSRFVPRSGSPDSVGLSQFLYAGYSQDHLAAPEEKACHDLGHDNVHTHHRSQTIAALWTPHRSRNSRH